MNTIYKIGEMAEKLHKTVRTLQAWDRKGVLSAHRTPTGRRYYTHAQLLNYFGELPPAKERRKIAYCRVSSYAQKPDLINQRKVIEDFCVAKGFAGVDFVDEIGGGMNFKRKKFLKLISAIRRYEVSDLIIAHKDRLVRFGFEYFAVVCAESGCTIHLLNNEQLSPEQEMVEDLMTIVHCFSSRLYGLRNYKKSLKKVLDEQITQDKTLSK